MSKLKRVVLDVLKPHSPDIVEFAKELSNLEEVSGVNISVYEMDKEVENVKITLSGEFNNIQDIKEIITSSGATIHSIDEVIAGKKPVEEHETLHDRHTHG